MAQARLSDTRPFASLMRSADSEDILRAPSASPPNSHTPSASTQAQSSPVQGITQDQDSSPWWQPTLKATQHLQTGISNFSPETAPKAFEVPEPPPQRSRSMDDAVRILKAFSQAVTLEKANERKARMQSLHSLLRDLQRTLTHKKANYEGLIKRLRVKKVGKDGRALRPTSWRFRSRQEALGLSPTEVADLSKAVKDLNMLIKMAGELIAVLEADEARQGEALPPVALRPSTRFVDSQISASGLRHDNSQPLNAMPRDRSRKEKSSSHNEGTTASDNRMSRIHTRGIHVRCASGNGRLSLSPTNGEASPGSPSQYHGSGAKHGTTLSPTFGVEGPWSPQNYATFNARLDRKQKAPRTTSSNMLSNMAWPIASSEGNHFDEMLSLFHRTLHESLQASQANQASLKRLQNLERREAREASKVAQGSSAATAPNKTAQELRCAHTFSLGDGSQKPSGVQRPRLPPSAAPFIARDDTQNHHLDVSAGFPTTRLPEMLEGSQLFPGVMPDINSAAIDNSLQKIGAPYRLSGPANVQLPPLSITMPAAPSHGARLPPPLPTPPMHAFLASSIHGTNQTPQGMNYTDDRVAENVSSGLRRRAASAHGALTPTRRTDASALHTKGFEGFPSFASSADAEDVWSIAEGVNGKSGPNTQIQANFMLNPLAQRHSQNSQAHNTTESSSPRQIGLLRSFRSSPALALGVGNGHGRGQYDMEASLEEGDSNSPFALSPQSFPDSPFHQLDSSGSTPTCPPSQANALSSTLSTSSGALSRAFISASVAEAVKGVNPKMLDASLVAYNNAENEDLESEDRIIKAIAQVS